MSMGSRTRTIGRWRAVLLLACLSLLVTHAHAWGPYGQKDEGEGSSGWGGPWDNNNDNGGSPTLTGVDNTDDIATTTVIATAAAYNGGGYGGPGYGGGGGGGGGSGIGNGNGNGPGGGFPGSSSPVSANPGFDVQRATRFREIHGILAAVAMVGLFPVGAVLVRVVPGRLAWVAHALTQAVAYVVFVAAAALGLYLVSMVRIPPDGASLLEQTSTNAHPIIGLVVLGILTLQPGLGLLHHARYKRLGRRTVWSHAHIWAGRGAVTLGIVNGGLGLGLARADRGAVIAYAVVAAFVWLFWMLAATWGEVRVRRRERGQQVGEGRLRGGEGGALPLPKYEHEADASVAGGGDGSRSDIPRGVGVGGGRDNGGSMTATVGGSDVSSISRVSNTTAAAEAAAAAIAASFLHQQQQHTQPSRPATPSPPYTPGPAASTEWTIYGGPGLNNTPRGNNAGMLTQEEFPKSS